MLKKVFLGISFLAILSYAQHPYKGVLLSKSVFEEKMVWDNIRGNIRKMVAVSRVKMGAILVYMNTLINQSKKSRKQIVVESPIPYGTTYIRGTSSCEGVCEMLYSIDGGTSFKKSEELFVVYGTKKRVPMASEYTHIKFIFSQLSPYTKIRMAFKVKVK